MDRHINEQNENLYESSEDSFQNQCESCCNEFQESAAYPYRCVYTDVIHQYEMRLKKAHTELTDKEFIIALLKDQHAKMENYCRCSLEETQSIKAKYYHLVQEMDNIRKENSMQRGTPVYPNNESLESYIRSEVGIWKKENKEILDKIEVIDFDVQKLLQILSDTQGRDFQAEIERRMARMEKIIESQSLILTSLHTKFSPRANADFGVIENIDKPQDEVRDDLSSLGRTPSVDTRERISLDSTFNSAMLPPILGEYMEQNRIQDLEQENPAIVLSPEDDVRIPIHTERASNSKDSMHPMQMQENQSGSSSHKNFNNSASQLLDADDQPTSKTAATDTGADIEQILSTQNFNDGETSTTNTELIGDFLEIAKKEQNFFVSNGISSNSEISVFTPTSEHLSAISELTSSENEKIFRELPLESNKPPRKNWNSYGGFNEFEHFESAFFSDPGNSKYSFIPTKVIDGEENQTRSEENLEKPTIKIIPECCIVPYKNSEGKRHENNFQIIIFEDIDKNMIPSCCKPLKELEDSLTIEEVITPKSSEYTDSFPEMGTAAQEPSLRNEKIPRNILPTNLDDTFPISLESDLRKLGEQRSIFPECCRITGAEEETSSFIPSEDRSRDFEDLSLIPVVSLNMDMEEDERMTRMTPEIREEMNIKNIHPYSEKQSPLVDVSDPQQNENVSPYEVPIIYELEIPPRPVSEEEITRKFMPPFLEELAPNGNDRDSELNLKNEGHDKSLFSLGEDLQKANVKLNDVLILIKQEASSLFDLKEDLKAMNNEWNQDMSIIKSNIEFINKKMNGVDSALLSIMADMKSLLNNKIQGENQAESEDMEKSQRENTDDNKVIHKVRSLEKRLCRCGLDSTREKIKQICQPSTGCSCKYRTINEGEKSSSRKTDGKKISFTVRSCVLNPNTRIRPPVIL